MVNVVFHTPGTIWNPDFEGIRLHRYSKKDNMLRVQVAVPENEMDGSNPGRFIFDAIRKALNLTQPRFARYKIPFSVADHLALIDAIENEWRTQVRTAAP